MTSTCVLIAGEQAAATYESSGGSYRLHQVMPRPGGNGDADLFAQHLISGFYRSVQNNVYDGLIIMAVPAMRDALQRWLSPEIRKLVIAELSLPQAFCIPKMLPASLAVR